MVSLRANEKSPRMLLLGLYSASGKNTGWKARLGSVSREEKQVRQKEEESRHGCRLGRSHPSAGTRYIFEYSVENFRAEGNAITPNDEGSNAAGSYGLFLR